MPPICKQLKFISPDPVSILHHNFRHCQRQANGWVALCQAADHGQPEVPGDVQQVQRGEQEEHQDPGSAGVRWTHRGKDWWLPGKLGHFGKKGFNRWILVCTSYITGFFCPLFFLFTLVIDSSLHMSGFELRIPGVGSNCNQMCFKHCPYLPSLMKILQCE